MGKFAGVFFFGVTGEHVYYFTNGFTNNSGLVEKYFLFLGQCGGRWGIVVN
ncbi:hypothetical protein FD09_GL001385 [Schleiferilactobacillus perolens DSM 12744]|uniref:Uncharacterized protein n=1 Tax=Schleiferilactobacillus perolens DSM 12744 TaxID=1423792 RepID=A0A0R1N1V2_9LACO|nr:hypothetical protein FD09_GL001385 [Schleiferilactobacillus perolens DSM 12744]